MIYPVDYGINIERPDSLKKGDKYLSGLLRLQSIFGITYCGNCGNTSSKNVAAFRKSLLVLFDFMIMISFIGFEYLAYDEGAYNRVFTTSSNKMAMRLIFLVSAFAMAIEFFIIKIMTLVNGSNIISTVLSFGNYC